MTTRGVRGATVCNSNTAEDILTATKELLEKIVQTNPTMLQEDLASILFTVTADLTAVHPAKAARLMGWGQTPLMCAQEIPVPGSLPKCIRVLIHWNTMLPQEKIVHVYLHEAAALRPDLMHNE
ncbi:MAG: chorismate mutase [Anaerolineaceae bacterium]|nr:chorismate mutase [Anaerolineaceae bacterium]